MTTAELLERATYQFGDARIVITLINPHAAKIQSILEVKAPIDRNWRQAAEVTRASTPNQVVLGAPPKPTDATDWKRTQALDTRVPA